MAMSATTAGRVDGGRIGEKLALEVLNREVRRNPFDAGEFRLREGKRHRRGGGHDESRQEMSQTVVDVTGFDN